MDENYIKEIAKALYKRHAALMVGAGMSKNAISISSTSKGFLDWNQLSDTFYDLLYENNDNKPKKEYYNTIRLAQELEAAYGRENLDEMIKEALPDDKFSPSKVYEKLLMLPWNDIFTTNYDTLLERAAENTPQSAYYVVNNQQDLINTHNVRRIVKLHGSFPSTRPFIITEEDFRTYPQKFALFINTVQQSMLENVFCLIGFSGDDPNFIKWVGWVHDHLGAEQSPKIYMISVNHLPKAQQLLFEKRNISIIDLETLWPNDKYTPAKRIEVLLDEIRKEYNTFKKDDEWINDDSLLKGYPVYNYVIDHNRISGQKTKSEWAESWIDNLNHINDIYPGWIFLPWNMKSQADYILGMFGEIQQDQELFGKLSTEYKIKYLYQYLRFADIIGRPLRRKRTLAFWNIMKDIEKDLVELNLVFETQFIYLQLLRSFRELAMWSEYDACLQLIDNEKLTNEQKYFLIQERCWYDIFHCNFVQLNEKLNSWKLNDSDVYWHLIRSSMYAIAGKTEMAKVDLRRNIITIRKQLSVNSGDPFLSSLEESCVSLYNFIEQGDSWLEGASHFETTMNSSKVSWGEMNRNYYLKINSLDSNKVLGRKTVEKNFDLSINTSVKFESIYFSDINYSLDYLRFFEKTGHFFKLQNVINDKNAFKKVIEFLSPQYSRWCLIQAMIMGEDEALDNIYGRNVLSEMSHEEVDRLVDEDIEAVDNVAKQIDTGTKKYKTNVYEQIAHVLPEIIARLCTKCSDSALLKVLDMSNNIVEKKLQTKFKNLNNVYKLALSALKASKQREFIERLVDIPWYDDGQQINDPLQYLNKQDQRIKIDSHHYHTIIEKLKKLISSEDTKEKDAAINRLYILYHVIKLNKQEIKYLEKVLRDFDNDNAKQCLYEIDSDKYSKIPNEILKSYIENAISVSHIVKFPGDDEYNSISAIVKDADVSLVNIPKVFNEMMQTFAKLNNNSNSNISQIRQLFDVAVSLCLLIIKGQKKLEKDEIRVISQFFNGFSSYYNKSSLSIFKYLIETFLLVNDKLSQNDLKYCLLVITHQQLQLLNDFFKLLNLFDYNIRSNKDLESYCDEISLVMVQKLLDYTELEEKQDSIAILLNLSKLGYSFNNLDLLNHALIDIKDNTVIHNDDEEKEAMDKLICRIDTMRTVLDLEKHQVQINAIEEWEKVRSDPNEFAEVRNAHD